MAIDRTVRRSRAPIGLLFVGGAMVMLAAALLYWNEGHALRDSRMLDAARASLLNVGIDRVHPEHEGRLVFLRGAVDVVTPLLDQDFNQTAEGLALRRRVQMFQSPDRAPDSHANAADVPARVDADSDAVDRSGWMDQPNILAGSAPAASESAGEFPIQGRTWWVDRARLGAFELTPAVIRKVDGFKPMAVDLDQLTPNLAASFRPDERWLSTSDVLDAPEAGDLRIGYERIAAGTISVIAMQRGEQLEPWPYRGGALMLVGTGDLASDDLLAAAVLDASARGQYIQAGGFMLMWLGLLLLAVSRLIPQAKVNEHAALAKPAPSASRLPLGIAVTLTALAAGGVSYVATGTSWLFDRPVLLFVLILMLAAAVAWTADRRGAPQ